METRPDKLTTAQSARLASLSVKENSSARDLERIALEIQLRQWCVDQAIIIAPRLSGPTDFKTICEGIFDFVTEPLK
jgi:hypothetical protein